MTVYRVFPFDANAGEREPGGALHVPRGGKGRIDSLRPSAYSVFYAASTAECAVAERFGAFDVWDRTLVEAAPATPLLAKSRFALAAYDVAASLAVCDLDDAPTLVAQQLCPSHVVTRDRSVTQAWATRIHARATYAGIAWWSYYEPSWHSIGFWSHGRIRLASAPEPLTVGDARVRSAALTIKRRLVAR